MEYVCLFINAGNKQITVVYEKSKWFLNKEVNGEWIEIPTPPQEVIDYFNKVIFNGF